MRNKTVSLAILVTFSIVLLFISGCSPNAKYMCFCKSSSSTSFNHWVFVPNPKYNEADITNFFVFDGNAQACHKACNKLLEKSLPETSLSYKDPYFGIESKLVPVSDDDLKDFALASGINAVYLVAAAGQPVKQDAVLASIYSNLNSNSQSSALSKILNNPKFLFLNHNIIYCEKPLVCVWASPTGTGSASDFNMDVGEISSSVTHPDDYECSAPTSTTVVVNDKFCWLADPKEDPPICPNVKNPKKDVPLYGCLCVKSKSDVYGLTMSQIKSRIITRDSSYCCNNGQKVSCK